MSLANLGWWEPSVELQEEKLLSLSRRLFLEGRSYSLSPLQAMTKGGLINSEVRTTSILANREE